eukprot:jgi/Botrbrau1/4646/Bobra.33_2s0017.1
MGKPPRAAGARPWRRLTLGILLLTIAVVLVRLYLGPNIISLSGVPLVPGGPSAWEPPRKGERANLDDEGAHQAAPSPFADSQDDAVHESAVHIQNMRVVEEPVLRKVELSELHPWAAKDEHPRDAGPACPFERIPLAEVKDGRAWPYILGEDRRPNCTNCHRMAAWENSCYFSGSREDNSICPADSRKLLLEYLVGRAEAGAPGYAEMLSMTPCDLFPLFRGRTLWIIGDSQSLEFANALYCFLLEFHDGVVHHSQKEFLGTSSDILEQLKYSFCIHLRDNTRLCHLRCNTGVKLAEVVLPLLAGLGAFPRDIMLLNFGLHINWPTDYMPQLYVFQKQFLQLRSELPFAIWAESSPQHFPTYSGDFGCPDCPDPSTFKTPVACQAVAKVSLNRRNELEVSVAQKQIVAEGGWRNKAAGPIMARLGIPIMRVWNHSLPLWHFHHHLGRHTKNDCTHSCHPSVYEMWIYFLYQILEKEQDNIMAQDEFGA